MIDLVVIGESLSRGFSERRHPSHTPQLPGLLAHAVSLGPDRCHIPDVSGQVVGLAAEYLYLGGLSLNIEDLLQRLDEYYGERINPFEVVPAIATARGLRDDVEDYWERGPDFPGRRFWPSQRGAREPSSLSDLPGTPPLSLLCISDAVEAQGGWP